MMVVWRSITRVGAGGAARTERDGAERERPPARPPLRAANSTCEDESKASNPVYASAGTTAKFVRTVEERAKEAKVFLTPSSIDEEASF